MKKHLQLAVKGSLGLECFITKKNTADQAILQNRGTINQISTHQWEIELIELMC